MRNSDQQSQGHSRSRSRDKKEESKSPIKKGRPKKTTKDHHRQHQHHHSQWNIGNQAAHLMKAFAFFFYKVQFKHGFSFDKEKRGLHKLPLAEEWSEDDQKRKIDQILKREFKFESDHPIYHNLKSLYVKSSYIFSQEFTLEYYKILTYIGKIIYFSIIEQHFEQLKNLTNQIIKNHKSEFGYFSLEFFKIKKIININEKTKLYSQMVSEVYQILKKFIAFSE